MESISTPRVSGRYIDSYINRTVMVVGKVIQLRGSEALIEADGQININLNPVCFSCQPQDAQMVHDF